MGDQTGHDDPVERLRSALDELTAGIAADAPDLLGRDTNERVVHQDRKPHAMTDRSPRWRPLAAAAAAVIVAGGGVMLLGGGDDGSLGTTDPPVTAPATGDDRESATTAADVDRFQWEFELPPRTDARGSEWARTAPGSQTLRVAFGHFNRTPVPGNLCAPEFVPDVTETDAEVRVAVTAVVEFSADAPADRFDWFITDDGTVVADCPAQLVQRIVDVDLAMPLGGRRLVFAGQHVDVFTTQLSTPRWMPDGWQPTLDEAFGLYRPDVDVPVWYRTWESQPETRGQFLCEPRTQTGLALIEGPAGLVANFVDDSWDPGIIGTHEINGVAADYALDADTNRTRLAWTIGDTAYVLQSLEFATLCPLGDPPDIDTTLRFARELIP